MRLHIQPITGERGDLPPACIPAPVGPPSSPTVGAAISRRRESAPMPAPQAHYRGTMDPSAWAVRQETDRRAQEPQRPLEPTWLRAERETAQREDGQRQHARWLAATGSATTGAALALLAPFLAMATALAIIGQAVNIG